VLGGGVAPVVGGLSIGSFHRVRPLLLSTSPSAAHFTPRGPRPEGRSRRNAAAAAAASARLRQRIVAAGVRRLHCCIAAAPRVLERIGGGRAAASSCP
jgi:hypothetical protein